MNNTFLRRDGSNTVIGDNNMDNHKLNNIGDPSADGDVVTREYVDRSVRDTCDAVKAD
jgi:hypothetical protein